MANADKFLEELEKQKKKKKKRGEDTSSLEPIAPSKEDITGDDQVNSFFDALNTEREKLRQRESVTWEDIAPVKPTVGTTDRVHGGRGGSFTVKSEEDDSLLDFFQKGAFSDGYQVGDVSKAILGTVGDIGVGAVKGVMKLGEGIGDAAQYGVAAVADAFGGDEWADKVRRNAQRTAIDDAFAPVDKKLDRYSVSGRTLDAASEAIGQIGGIIATGGIAGMAGAGAAGATAATTGVMGLSSFGSSTGEAYKGGAETGEAELYGAIAGTADAVSELIFGGLGKAVGAVGLSKGLSSADDILAKKVSEKITNTIAKNAVQLGIKAGAEGTEEVLAGLAQAAGKKLTYMSEEEIGQIIADENLLEQFVVGAMASGVAQVPSFVQANKTDTDFITGRTKNEQAVIDRVVEQRVKEAETDGTKLKPKQRQEIEEQAASDMERGRIDIETIEEVLGGDEYKAYQDAVKEEDALRKEYEELGALKEPTLAEKTRYEELHAKKAEIFSDERRTALKSKVSERVSQMAGQDRLAASFTERARRGEYFSEDVSKYKSDAAKKTVQNLVDSKLANNTGRTHDMAETVAKIAEDKGIVFNFTNNQKLRESGKTAGVAENAIINGYKDAEGITVNLDSPKAWQFIVGHEVTHTLEGTAEYTELANAVKVYAQTKGEYDSRRAGIASLYAEGTDVDSELTSDMIGEYVFTDEQFVTELSTKHQNVFQKVFAEIKHLLKMVTAGSKEARQLERVKHTFEKAYRAQQQTAKAQQTQHSLGYHAGDLGKAEFYHQQGGSRGTGHFGTGTYFVGDEQKISGDNTYGKRPHHAVEFDNYNLYKVRGDNDGFALHDQLKVIDGGFDAAYLRAAQEDKFRLSELRTEAYERAERYETNSYDEELGFDVSDNYIDANIRAFTEVAGENGIEIQNYDAWLAEQDDDVPSPGDSDYDYYKSDYLGYLKETLQEADSARNDGYADFRDAYFNLWLRFGKKNTDAALQAVIEHDAAMMPDGEFDYWSAAEKHADSRATVFMKALGYEGIDTRGTALDNVEYGSVIYDLKGEDAQRKAAAGAKFSLAASEIDGSPIDAARYSSNEAVNQYSLSHSKEIAAGQANYRAAHSANVAVSASELAEAQRVTAAMVDVMMQHSSILPEDKIGKVLTKNGSYDRSVENTTICVRTLAYNEFVDKVQAQIGRPLTQMESFLVSQKLYDIATDPQCLYCYVSLDRKSYNEMLLRYMQDRDTVIEKYNKSDKMPATVDALYQEFLNGRKDTKNMKDRFAKWIGYADDGVQMLSLADIATEDRQRTIQADGGMLAEQLKDARAYAQSASWSKIQKDYVAYRDEILKLGDRVVKNLNEHYGMRWYSFSDYSAAFIVENMQQITDASLRGLKGLSYTKDTDYAEIFAPTGMNINISVFVKKDANGNYYIDERQSANIEKAMELRDRYPNVGIVATVTDDDALRWAGEQEWTDVIIPFHIVRTGTDVAEYYKWLNYTAESADSVSDGNLWDAYVDSLHPKNDAARKKVSKNIYPSEHQNNRDTYLNLCQSRGLTPRFARFAGEDWYMKLVNETRLSAGETSSLKPIFNEQAAKDSFQKFVEKGGYEGGWYRDGVDVDAEARAVADDVLAGKQANEVAYGRQDGIAPADILARRRANRTHGQHSLSDANAPVGGRGTAARELRYQGEAEDIAPVQQAADVAPTAETIPGEHSEIDRLNAEYDAVRAEFDEISARAQETYSDLSPEEQERVMDEVLAVGERLKAAQDALNAAQQENLASFTDADVPPEMDAPYYGDEEQTMPDDPMADRDEDTVGNRSVKAYQYLNPEVKPYFQTEANAMLGDLRRATRGERMVTWDTAGNEGKWTGQKRVLAYDLAGLKDQYGYSYEQLEKGIQAIIDDEGAENNAVSKRIELLIHERLAKGYVDAYSGVEIPANTEYLDFLRTKQITEYNDAAFDALMADADAHVPPIAEDIAPVAEAAPAADPLAGVSSAVDTEVEEIEIETTLEKLQAKKKFAETELADYKQQREKAAAKYQERIDELKAKLDGKKRKDTKAAVQLGQQITRLERLKADVDADFAKKISDTEKRIARREYDMQQDHTEADKLERAYAKIDRQLEHDRAALEAEFAQRRAEAIGNAKTRGEFTKRRALELYRELNGLKKGVRASEWLGEMLDVSKQYGISWNELREGLLRVSQGGRKKNVSADAAKYDSVITEELEQRKAELAEEYDQRRSVLQGQVGDRLAYISGRAVDLYRELNGLKKGVRASESLSMLLDYAKAQNLGWNEIKSALLVANRWADEVINPENNAEVSVRNFLETEYSERSRELADIDNMFRRELDALEEMAETQRGVLQRTEEQVAQNTAAESIVREQLKREYDYKLHGDDTEYQDRLAELEAEAARQKEEARTREEKLYRAQLHENIMEDMRSAFAARGIDLDELLRVAKNVSGFKTVDKTPQRVNFAAFGDEAGEVMNDLTVNRVAQNETEGIRWLNQYTDPKNGLIAQISRQYHIKPGSKESAAAQMYAEGFYVNEYKEIIEYGDRELAADFPDAKVQDNIKGLARDGRIRAIYDQTLDAINEVRVRNAYPEIPKRKDYFLHFREMGDFFSKNGLPFNPNDMRLKDLPTDINGMTADLKPGKPYFASEHRRQGKRTSFDLLGGLEQYLTSAKDQIYHIDDIQTFRALRNYIADDFGQAKGLDSLAGLSEDEVQERIQLVFGNHLSTYAKFLNEEANILAGKTALMDRALEGVIGRRGMTFMSDLNKQVGANQVGFNISSSLTNFIAPVQAFAKMNKTAFVKGFAQTVSNRIGGIFGRGDNFADESPVMVRREGAKRFKTNWWQRRQDNAYALMGAVDSLTTEIIARAKFNELTAKGMEYGQAHYETDKWVSALMGDRSLGQMPHLFNSKTFGMILKYQLEVRNQIDSMFADTIREAKLSTAQIEDVKKRNAVKAAKIASTFATLAVSQHVFGQVFESIAGYNPAFDIIEAIIKAAGWDDDEDDDDTVLDNLEQGLLSIAEDMPYYSILSGGRIPLESALPIETLIKGKDSYGNEVSRWKTALEAAPYYVLPGGYGQIKKTAAGLGMYSDEHPVAGSYTDSGNMRFPVGTAPLDVAQAAVFGQYSSGNARDYFDDERKPLSPKQVDEYAAADMTIQDYWKYRDGLKEHEKLADQAEYINSLDIPTWKKNLFINNLTDRKEAIDMADYGQYGSLSEMDFAKKSPEKYRLLQNEGVSYEQFTSFDDKKKNAYSWAAENPEKYSFVRDIGYTIDDYARATDTEKDAWNWAYNNPEKYLVSRAVSDDLFVYRGYTDALNDIKADKDADGKSISGSRKDKVVDYINGLDADYGAKIILLKTEYPSEDSYNYDIIDYLNEREDITAEEMTVILTQLGFRVTSDGTITWD